MYSKIQICKPFDINFFIINIPNKYSVHVNIFISWSTLNCKSPNFRKFTNICSPFVFNLWACVNSWCVLSPNPVYPRGLILTLLEAARADRVCKSPATVRSVGGGGWGVVAYERVDGCGPFPPKSDSAALKPVKILPPEGGVEGVVVVWVGVRPQRRSPRHSLRHSLSQCQHPFPY